MPIVIEPGLNLCGIIAKKNITMKENIIIRPAQTKDFTQIMSLLPQLWPKRKLNPAAIKKVFNKQLKIPNTHYLHVAEHNKKVVGFISFSWRLNIYSEGLIGRIEELIIDKKYRNKGIGGKMVKDVIAICKKKKINYLYLTSAFRRKEAHKFYENLGFEKSGFELEKIF